MNKPAMTTVKGNPILRYGWGIGQLDKKAPPIVPDLVKTNFVSTAQVYNWKSNVAAALALLNEKLTIHNKLINDFKRTYDCGDPNVSTNIHNVPFDHEMFGVTVHYNGADKITIPASYIKTTQINPKTGENVWTNIWSPVSFNVKDSGEWTFHDNTNRYARKIAALLPPNPAPTARE